MIELIPKPNPVISRQEAKRQRMKYYFPGYPCRNGHESVRLVSTGRCTMCRKLSN